mgnify:CR=1 FL=1
MSSRICGDAWYEQDCRCRSLPTESIRRAEDPYQVAEREAADIAVLKVQPLGGVRACLEIAERIGLPVVVSSALETSVGIRAGLALAAALPELPYACGLNTVALLADDLARRAADRGRRGDHSERPGRRPGGAARSTGPAQTPCGSGRLVSCELGSWPVGNATACARVIIEELVTAAFAMWCSHQAREARRWRTSAFEADRIGLLRLHRPSR